MNWITKQLVPLIAILAVLVMYVLGWRNWSTSLSMNQDKLRNQAVDGCMSGARKAWSNKEGSAEEIDLNIYQQCMKDKGY